MGFAVMRAQQFSLLERRHLAGQWNISIDSEFEKSAI
jgi:hypothetical protein